MKAEKTVVIVNPRNGEIFEKKSLVDLQFDDDDGYLFKPNQLTIRQFKEGKPNENLSWQDRGRIDELKYHMLKNQFLMYKSGNRLCPLRVKEIGKLVGLCDKKAKEFLKKIIQYGVIKEVIIDGTTYFAMNPLYAMKTKRITLTTYMIFHKELENVLPDWVNKKFSELGNPLRIKVVGDKDSKE